MHPEEFWYGTLTLRITYFTRKGFSLSDFYLQTKIKQMKPVSMPLCMEYDIVQIFGAALMVGAHPKCPISIDFGSSIRLNLTDGMGIVGCKSCCLAFSHRLAIEEPPFDMTTSLSHSCGISHMTLAALKC